MVVELGNKFAQTRTIVTDRRQGGTEEIVNQGKPILAVGAANAERLLKVRSLNRGGKTVIPPATMAAGGSAVNHTCRLLAAGVAALPVLPVGDDYPAQLVRQVIMESAATGATPVDFTQKLDSWFARISRAGATTGYTTIVVEPGGERTIFSETSTSSPYFGVLCAELSRELSADSISGLIVGHIHADAAPSPDMPQGSGGVITSKLLSHFHEDVPVVLNLGRSQYRLGSDYWLDKIRKADIFQATYEEAVEFITVKDGGQRSLRDVARWFQKKNITAVITVDRLGALGIMKNDDRVVVAWPYELGEEAVDSTGAGDAMAAGLIAHLSARGRSNPLDVEGLRSALDDASVWAAYACTTFGGAVECPSRTRLDAFARERAHQRRIEVVSIEDPHAQGFMLMSHHRQAASFHPSVF